MKRVLGLITAVMVCEMICAQVFVMSFPNYDNTTSKNDSTSSRVLTMTASIADHISHVAITNAKCELLAAADSSYVDSVQVEKWEEGDYKVCWASFQIKQPGSYLLKVEAEGYTTQYVPVNVKRIYKRELMQELKTIYLKKQPKKNDILLGEVVVKATKLKFYMNGDTLVYDADAFNLAEGSMLDGLIKKLPGVKMEKGGVIKVNGRKIDALLLNGKDFFNSDRELMLENMPAYMVKNVQVYDRVPKHVVGTAQEKNTAKEFVMNVKLKKEYQSGWLVNSNLGGGLPMRDATGDSSEKRYLARFFALRFSDNSRMTFYANANNLNDSRQPGEENEWTPSEQARGLQKNLMAGINYNYTKGERFDYDGSVNGSYSETDNAQYTNSGRYTGDVQTFSKSMNAGRSYDFSTSTYHNISYWGRSSTLWKYFKGVSFEFNPNFSYNRFNRNSSDASVQLSDDVASQLGKAWLDSIKAPQAGELLKQYAIHRSITTAKGDGHSSSANLTLQTFFSPAHNDFLRFRINAGYTFNDNKNHDYNHYTLTYPHATATTTADELEEKSMSPDLRNRFNNNISRNSEFNVSTHGFLMLDKKMRNTISLSYEYRYSHDKSNLSLYLLNKLDTWKNFEQHPIGSLPSADALLMALDKGNSSRSETTHHTHTINAGYNYMMYNDTTKNSCNMNVGLKMPFDRESLDYHQRGVDTLALRNTFLPSPFIGIQLYNSKKMTGLSFTYNLNLSAPTLTTLLNITNDANPLNEIRGNAHLKKTLQHSIILLGNAKWHKLMYHGSTSLTVSQNDIATSVIYDMEAGGKTIAQPVNINGNWNAGADAGVDFPVGKFNFSNNITYNYYHSVDLSGTDASLGAIRSVVNNNNLNNYLRVTYEPTDKMEFGLDGRMSYQNQSSKRAGFNPVNAFDFNYGIRTTIELPLNFQVSTDLTMYSRRGYADKTSNTNELVWNARISKRFMKGNLIVQLDGFDILGNLSNVYRSVNAQGYTETFYNVIPSYCLLHVGWKLNKKQKKQADADMM